MAGAFNRFLADECRGPNMRAGRPGRVDAGFIQNSAVVLGMKKYLLPVVLFFGVKAMYAQRVKASLVPVVVKTALRQQYPAAKGVNWEMEHGNYEANWGGKSGEDNSVVYTPGGDLVEMVTAMPVTELPGPVAVYVRTHYNGARITEAGKVRDAGGKIRYEAEVRGKDLIFDEKGNFLKID